MKRSKNAVIGIVVLSAIAILILGLNFLKGNSFFTTEQTYYAKYSRVDGLKKSSFVTLKGLKIGQIKSIDFIDNGNTLLVEFTVNNDVKFPKNTIARIISSDIMGTKQLQLILGSSPKKLQPGDTLAGQTVGDFKEQVSIQMLPMKEKAEKLMSSVDSVLSVIQYVFNKDTRERLQNSIASIDQTFLQLKSTAAALNTIINSRQQNLSNIIVNIDSISHNLKNNNKNITQILKKFAAISDSLSAADIGSTLTHLQSTMQNIDGILAKINNGEGSLGSLMTKDSLYNNLADASESLNNLLIDIKTNPKKYLHFSIFDTGKKVYMNNPKDRNVKQVMYAIQILSSPKKIDVNSAVFKKYQKIDVVYYKGEYRYIIYKNKNEKKIIRNLNKVRKDFPEAFIIRVTEEKIP